MDLALPKAEQAWAANTITWCFDCFISAPRNETVLVTANCWSSLPCIYEVLGHADTGWRACDRDLAHGWAISGTGYFDVSSRDLADLIDLTALSSNYTANKLEGERGKHVN